MKIAAGRKRVTLMPSQFDIAADSKTALKNLEPRCLSCGAFFDGDPHPNRLPCHRARRTGIMHVTSL